VAEIKEKISLDEVIKKKEKPAKRGSSTVGIKT
jgi:hypothetical protein